MAIKVYGKPSFFKKSLSKITGMGSCPSVNKGKIVFMGALNPVQKKELNALVQEDVIDVLDTFSMECI